MWRRGGIMVSVLVPRSSSLGSSPGRGLCVVSLVKKLSQCPSPPRSIQCKWIPTNCWGNLVTNCGRVTCDGLVSCSGGVEILLATSCYRNRDKLRLAMGQSAPRLHTLIPWLNMLLLLILHCIIITIIIINHHHCHYCFLAVKS